MAIISDISDFDFAYNGYQYPLPPSWKYAIRQQDQIVWLYNACAHIANLAISQDELNTFLDYIRSYVTEQLSANNEEVLGELNNFEQIMEERFNALTQLVTSIEQGIARWKNPINGRTTYAANIDKMLYDLMRPYSATYGTLDTYFANDTYSTVQDSYFGYYANVAIDMYNVGAAGIYSWGNELYELENCSVVPFDPEEYYGTQYPTRNNFVISDNYLDLSVYGFATIKEGV